MTAGMLNIFIFPFCFIELTTVTSLSDAESDIEEDTLSTNIFVAWDKRKERLEHEYAVTTWSLSLLPEIRLDVRKNFDGDKHLIVEKVITKLHEPPCPNPDITTESMTEIIDLYWKEYCDFDEKTGIFEKRANFPNF